MPANIILQPSPDAAALTEKRRQLAAVRAALAEREADLAQFRSQLKAFESRYLHRVGILYAELDEIAARITEREVDLYDSDSARRRAEQARQRAQETHDAAFGADNEPEEFDPPPSLKTLFREVAKRIHPDFASDPAEQKHLTLLMMRANQAYSRGDADTLQRLLALLPAEGTGLTLESLRGADDATIARALRGLSASLAGRASALADRVSERYFTLAQGVDQRV